MSVYTIKNTLGFPTWRLYKTNWHKVTCKFGNGNTCKIDNHVLCLNQFCSA